MPLIRGKTTVAVAAVLLGWLFSSMSPATAAEPCPAPPSCAWSVEQLGCLSPLALDRLYRNATFERIPCGVAGGVALPAPGPLGCQLRKRLINAVWLGKEFREDQTLINHWRGLKAIEARVYPGTSWVDGQPALIMDYRGASLVWTNVRDEMREVAPGIFLGMMFLRRPCRPSFRMYFVLQFPDCPGK